MGTLGPQWRGSAEDKQGSHEFIRKWPRVPAASSILLNQLKPDSIFESHLPALLPIKSGFEIFPVNGFEYKKQ